MFKSTKLPAEIIKIATTINTKVMYSALATAYSHRIVCCHFFRVIYLFLTRKIISIIKLIKLITRARIAMARNLQCPPTADSI